MATTVLWKGRLEGGKGRVGEYLNLERPERDPVLGKRELRIYGLQIEALGLRSGAGVRPCVPFRCPPAAALFTAPRINQCLGSFNWDSGSDLEAVKNWTAIGQSVLQVGGTTG